MLLIFRKKTIQNFEYRQIFHTKNFNLAEELHKTALHIYNIGHPAMEITVRLAVWYKPWVRVKRKRRLGVAELLGDRA